MSASKREVIAPTWEAQYSFSPAVSTEGGKIVWLAGQVGFVDDNRKPLTDFDSQVRQTLRNIERLMAKAGGALDDIVSMTVFVSDGRYSQRFTDLRKEFWSEKYYPASTLIVAAGFALPEIMVEVTGYAVIATK